MHPVGLKFKNNVHAVYADDGGIGRGLENLHRQIIRRLFRRRRHDIGNVDHAAVLNADDEHAPGREGHVGEFEYADALRGGGDGAGLLKIVKEVQDDRLTIRRAGAGRAVGERAGDRAGRDGQRGHVEGK